MIRPISLVLHNVCQHTYKEIKYQKGITGVTGKNGSGKSNLVTSAQYFAITGKAYDRTKSDLLNWHAVSGKTVFTFEHAGDVFTLTRSVNSSHVSLTSASNAVSLKGPDASAFMQDALGADANTLLTTCWIPQGSLGEVLKMTDSARLTFFQKLAGVLVAERIRGVINAAVAKIPTYPDRTEEVKAAKQSIAEYEDTIKGEQASVAGLKTRVDQYAEEREKQYKITMLPSEEDYKLQAETAQKRRDDAQAALDKYVADNAASLSEEASNAPDSMTSEEYAAMSAFPKIPAAEAAVKEASNALAAAELAAVVTEQGLAGCLTMATENASTARAKRNAADKHLSDASQGKCPTCGHELSQEKKAELEAAVTQCVKDQAAAEEVLAKTITAANAALGVTASVDNCRRASEELARLLKATEGFSLEKIKADEVLRTSWAERSRALQAVRSRKAVLESDLHVCKEQYMRASAGKETASVAAITAAREFVAQYDVTKQSMHSYEVSISSNVARVDSLKNQLDLYRKDAEAQVRCDKARAVMEEVRGALHRNKAPRLVMQKMLIGLNARLSHYLGAFEVEFTAYINEDFQFLCKFKGGIEAQASLLSGGQTVALAVAFGFALSDLLAGNLPLIVLDEPTVFLDDANVGRLVQVLEMARGLAKRGVFIQVATHEPAIMSAFTQSIEV